MTYFDKSDRVQLLEEVGEVAFPVARAKTLKVNGHLFIGEEASVADMNRRAFETFPAETHAADRRERGKGSGAPRARSSKGRGERRSR